MKASRIFAVIGIVLILALSACSGKDATPGQASETSGGTITENTSGGSESPDEPATTGKGDFNLNNPAAGLEELTSYQVTLIMKFEGTSNGSPFSAEQQFSAAVDRLASLRTLTENYENSNGETDALNTTALGGLVYALDTETQTCNAVSTGESDARVYEPAGSLPAFRGGEEAGSEIIDGVNAKVYTFDALALNAGKDAKADGKVWIADPGGWVVKYSLTLQAGEEVFGKGYEGTQTWEYTLTQANTAVVELPQGCTAPLTGLPVLEDAAGLQQLPGGMHYSTAQSADAVGTFYKDQLTAAGWEVKNELPSGSAGAQWLFSKVEERKELVLMVLAQPQEDGSLLVSLMQVETKAAVAQ